MKDFEEKIRKYYATFESLWGYKFFMWDAKHFGYYPDKIANIPERKALELQQELIAKKLDLKSGQRVLDAGCGRGVTACFIAKKYGVHVTGIDLLDFEVTAARKRAARLGLGGKVKFEIMDFSNLDFSEGYFDSIYTSETLSHAPNLGKVLCEFYRVLKPGGRLVLAEYTLAQDGQFSGHEMKSIDTIIQGSAMFGLKTFRHNTFPEILRSVGFDQVHQENITDNFFPSLYRLYRKSRWVYRVIKLLKLERWFFNAGVPTRLVPLVKKDLFRYCIFTAIKPFS